MGCGKLSTNIPTIDAPPVPIARNDGWSVSSLEEQGIDPQRIAHISEEIRNGDFEEVHGLLIVRNGYLVFEEYYQPGHGIDETHRLASVTKSIISLLIGAAIHNGYITGHDQPLEELFPDEQDVFDDDPNKKDLLLWHALTMSAGFKWKEGIGGDEGSDTYTMIQSPDSPHFVLTRPLADKPGNTFFYNDGLTILLAAAIENTSGLAADSFAVRYLFNPLDIQNYWWEYQTDGMIHAPGGLHLAGRDLAKIGQLCLQQGVWNGVRILPENWIDLSTREWIEATGGHQYGFQWWLRPPSGVQGFQPRAKDIYYASGYGGQKLFVISEYNMLIVFFGNDSWEQEDDHTVPHFIMYNILEAVQN